MVYLLPAVALLAGAGLLVRKIRRWAASGEAVGSIAVTTPSEASPPTAEAPVEPINPEADLPAGTLSEDDEKWIREQIGSLK